MAGDLSRDELEAAVERLDDEASRIAGAVLRKERLMYAALTVLRDERSGVDLQTRALVAEEVLRAGLTGRAWHGTTEGPTVE